MALEVYIVVVLLGLAPVLLLGSCLAVSILVAGQGEKRKGLINETPSCRTAKWQVVRSSGCEEGQEVAPEYWGLTIKQCRELLEECKEDPAWDDGSDLAAVVRRYVLPKTKGSGLGYALHLNQHEPKLINIMISHAWQENAERFIASLERTVNEDDVLFICALSLYQCEDGAGPSIKEQLGTTAAESPFLRVLAHIWHQGETCGWLWRHRRLLSRLPIMFLLSASLLYLLPMMTEGCVPTATGCATLSLGEWRYDVVDSTAEMPRVCFLAALLSGAGWLLSITILRHKSVYRGQMVAVPNHECDLYTRLWCVYEIFVATVLQVPVTMASTLAAAGTCSSREATCTNPTDLKRIREEIEQCDLDAPPGAVSMYDKIDAAVHWITRRAQLSIFWCLATRGLPIALMQVASMHVLCRAFLVDMGGGRLAACMGAGAFLGSAATCMVTLAVGLAFQGVVPKWGARLAALALLAAGGASLALAWAAQSTPGVKLWMAAAAGLGAGCLNGAVSMGLLSAASSVAGAKAPLLVLPSRRTLVIAVGSLVFAGTPALARSWAPAQLYPALVLNALVAGALTARLATLWGMACRWGVCIAPEDAKTTPSTYKQLRLG